MVSALVFACLVAARAHAQVAVGAGVERDRFTYRFDNDSSFNTSALVPHFFEQAYVADNIWLTGSARYRAGIRWETAGGVTPQRTGTADDFDTFFNPNGDVIVTGTTGGISIWSWRFEQRALLSGEGSPITIVNGYRLRVDRADWQLGHSTTFVNGRLVEAYDTTDREFTQSQMHEVFAGIRAVSRGHRWRSQLDAEVTPVMAGRLVVQLPDKYPGQDLVFLAKGVSGTVSLAVSRRGRVPLAVAVRAFHTWSVSASDQLKRNTLGVLLTIG